MDLITIVITKGSLIVVVEACHFIKENSAHLPSGTSLRGRGRVCRIRKIKFENTDEVGLFDEASQSVQNGLSVLGLARGVRPCHEGARSVA